MSTTRIAINGFGRIGRQVFKIIWGHHPEMQVAAIGVTDLTKTDIRALLLQYDSVYGRFPHPVDTRITLDAHSLIVDGCEVPIVPRQEGSRSWADYGIDIVIDATGRCKRRPIGDEHLSEGVQRVIVTEPTGFADVTTVYGVNHQTYDPCQHRVVSASSCTTTALSPAVMVLEDCFGVVEGFVTAVHAYTNSQSLVDTAHKDPRRSRAAGLNIIPTTTGISQALDSVLPGIGIRLGAAALRIPVPTVSMFELIVRLNQPATAEEVNDAFGQAAAGSLRGILDISYKPLVSTDYVGDSHSATVDALSTSVAGQLVRVAAWYDNEWGYSSRVADVTAHVARSSERRAAHVLGRSSEISDLRFQISGLRSAI